MCRDISAPAGSPSDEGGLSLGPRRPEELRRRRHENGRRMPPGFWKALGAQSEPLYARSVCHGVGSEPRELGGAEAGYSA